MRAWYCENSTPENLSLAGVPGTENSHFQKEWEPHRNTEVNRWRTPNWSPIRTCWVGCCFTILPEVVPRKSHIISMNEYTIVNQFDRSSPTQQLSKQRVSVQFALGQSKKLQFLNKSNTDTIKQWTTCNHAYLLGKFFTTTTKCGIYRWNFGKAGLQLLLNYKVKLIIIWNFTVFCPTGCQSGISWRSHKNGDNSKQALQKR